MKHKTIKKEVVKEECFVEKITCDMCGKKCPTTYGDWSGESWCNEHVRVSHERFSDGEYDFVDEYDICPECFKKIEGFIKSNKIGEIK